MNQEQKRLQEEKERKAYWLKWGPYVSDREWGTVREDYSADGDAWRYFPFGQAGKRAYRWGEDGIFGISDNHQRLCFSIALWNGKDPILKERFFGLSGHQGNHGEDVKEEYYFIDNLPSHTYMKALYHYPQAEFPYKELLEVNQKRTRLEPEYELKDTGIFEKGVFDVGVCYAKQAPESIAIKITVVNRGKEPATLHLLPTLWFRNTWEFEGSEKPSLKLQEDHTIIAEHPTLGTYYFSSEEPSKALFTENETNRQALYGTTNRSQCVKDGFQSYVIGNSDQAVHPTQGTKCTFYSKKELAPGETWELHYFLSNSQQPMDKSIFQLREQEANQFWADFFPKGLSDHLRCVSRQAFAGMLWCKQFYYYVVERWLEGDPGEPTPPLKRLDGRNADWIHVYNDDILSMPDSWEYPWFAAWDSAFQAATLSLIDPEFAKRQLMLLTREWYMHPNGQIPAYEWNFCDVNPPVHAWGAWRVFRLEKKVKGVEDELFLERVFQKLLLNFTWWVNRKDPYGRNLFQGGFLGLDNISVFDRSKPLPTGGHLDQADGTAWMGMYCLNMLKIALHLALTKPAYEDIASKFFEHFLYIANAICHIGEEKISLWDDEDKFFYDVVHQPDGTHFPLKVRSLVGLIPLLAVMPLESYYLDRLPGFKRRFEWFVKNRSDLCEKVACLKTPGQEKRRLLSFVGENKLKAILRYVLDENEFLSPFGIRSLSYYHKDHPYELVCGDSTYRVDYEPGESTTPLFGGNSNWRGPVWFPINVLLIEALEDYYRYVGDQFVVDCTLNGKKRQLTLIQVAEEISRRLMRLFPDGGQDQSGCHLYHEYYHADTGKGLGASHQTGWTGQIANLIHRFGVGIGES